MAKITLLDGTVFEGTPTELVGVARAFEESKHVAITATHTFNEGDKVRVLVRGEFGGVEVGDIGTVARSYADENDVYSVKIKSADDHDYFRPQDLELVSEEEAEADAIERKRNAIFTENGRKVNEYREGDIVKALNANSFGGVPGKVYEVSSVYGVMGGGNVKMKCGAISLVESTEIVAFVESRLDRN